jgi:hypothetical protein
MIVVDNQKLIFFSFSEIYFAFRILIEKHLWLTKLSLLRRCKRLEGVDKMRKETISKVLGKNVKLIKNDGFVLIGKIDKVYEDAIFFTTNQTSALISLDAIREIVFLNGGGS